MQVQDDKLDVKPDGDVDVEMKGDEASSPKDGDVSPIAQSVLNLGDESKASSSRIGKKSEPALEVRPNFSRVTPTQLAYISFPANDRYQPVRAVSAKTSPTKAGKAAASGRRTPPSTLGQGSEKYAGGGGILIMTDLRPNEEAEFIEIETGSTLAAPEAVVAPMANGDALRGRARLNISLDDTAPESDVPEAFEVSRTLSYRLIFY